VTQQGLVEAYIHTGGRIGAMIEVNCETDFVARTDEFKELAHNLAMQVAAQMPRYIAKEELPEGTDADPQAACLLSQPYIKDPTKTIRDVVAEVIARTGENIRISRFARFELGVKESGCKI
jgi:elongation factor Ts